jgi:hypothetical protein
MWLNAVVMFAFGFALFSAVPSGHAARGIIDVERAPAC